jgi:hypothetical protein
VKVEEGEGQAEEGMEGHSATDDDVLKPWHVRTYEYCAYVAELVSAFQSRNSPLLPVTFVLRTVTPN